MKTVSYRIYATALTISLSYFFFGIHSVYVLLSFAVADIIAGLTTYFTFEHIWIAINGFVVRPTKEDETPCYLSVSSFPTTLQEIHHVS